jgi:diguanylate cyclase
VLADLSDAKDAATVSAKILAERSRPFDIGRHKVAISCSIGISVYPRDGSAMNTLVANADVAMYHAKQEGRSGFVSSRRRCTPPRPLPSDRPRPVPSRMNDAA